MSQFHENKLSRREWLKMSAAGVAVGTTSGWLETLAADAAKNKERKGACILLWMTGGPSQTDTFDMKPDHANGGEFKPIETSVPGIQISEHLPNLAKQMQHVVPIRSMQSKEGDHERATFYLRTGYRPQGPVHYPTLGSLISRELGNDKADLPNFVSVSPFRVFSPAAYAPGFLGPQYAPVVIGEYRFGQQAGKDYEKSLQVANMQRPGDVDAAQADARLSLLAEMETGFGNARPGLITQSHQTAYQQAVRMMRSDAVKAFELDEEPAKLRDEYGRNQFGQSCLLARRLVERGVPFVEVSLNSVDGRQGFGWDTHGDNFNQVKALSGVLDPGWATLIKDLKDRGLLGFHHNSMDGRIRAHAQHQLQQRPRPFPGGLVHRDRGRRHQRRASRGQNQRIRDVRPRPPGQRARFIGHGRSFVGDRSHEAKHVQRGPPDSHCRPRSQTHSRDSRLSRGQGRRSEVRKMQSSQKGIVA